MKKFKQQGSHELTEDYKMEIATLLNPGNMGPINAELNASVQVDAICYMASILPGEHAYVYQDFDTDSDRIYLYDTANDTLTDVKKNPIDDTEISFSPINSDLDYVALQKVINTPDLGIFERKRQRILAGMDKYELYFVIQAIKLGTNKPSSIGMNTVTVATGDTIYHMIKKAYNKVRIYGSDYVMLAGSEVVNSIDSYNLDRAEKDNYKVGLDEFLISKKIQVIEVAEKLATVKGEAGAKILADDEFILVARKSNIDGGKPIIFARKEIPSEIANEAGVEVDSTSQRIIMMDASPKPITFEGVTKPVLGYGVYGFGEISIAIHNPLCIVSATDLALIL